MDLSTYFIFAAMSLVLSCNCTSLLLQLSLLSSASKSPSVLAHSQQPKFFSAPSHLIKIRENNIYIIKFIRFCIFSYFIFISWILIISYQDFVLLTLLWFRLRKFHVFRDGRWLDHRGDALICGPIHGWVCSWGCYQKVRAGWRRGSLNQDPGGSVSPSGFYWALFFWLPWTEQLSFPAMLFFSLESSVHKLHSLKL